MKVIREEIRNFSEPSGKTSEELTVLVRYKAQQPFMREVAIHGDRFQVGLGQEQGVVHTIEGLRLTQLPSSVYLFQNVFQRRDLTISDESPFGSRDAERLVFLFRHVVNQISWREHDQAVSAEIESFPNIYSSSRLALEINIQHTHTETLRENLQENK